MKSIIGPLLVAIGLAVAGGASWVAGQSERRLVGAHAQLATLRYGDAAATADAAERARADFIERVNILGLGRTIAALNRPAATDARDLHATADYWRSSYAAIAPQKDAIGRVVEADTAILTLAANASFRASQTVTDRVESLRRLDAAVKHYAELLKSEDGAVDAAYNYEFTIRTRDSLAKQRTPAMPGVAAKEAEPGGDLPAGPTLHGRPGGPPKAEGKTPFRIVIPRQSDERTNAPEAGKSVTKVRKG